LDDFFLYEQIKSGDGGEIRRETTAQLYFGILTCT